MGRGRGLQKPKGPHRKCVACRKVKPQAELLRLAARDGEAAPGRALPGRGAWLCREEACARAALKQGQIARALKGRGKEPKLPVLLGWLGLRSLDGDGGGGLKS